MFFRFINHKDNRDEYGRTYEEAFKEHALWCLKTVKENKPDNEELIGYIFKNSPTYVTRPKELREYLAGDAVFNALGEIKQRFEKFKKYYSNEDIQWLESVFKKDK